MSVHRQRLAVSAVLVTALTVTVTAGCASASKPGPSANPTMSTSASSSSSSVAAGVRGPQPGDLLISDGTAAVTVNGTKVSFPTTVTDASWSPDRSRIAFIDADGNVDSTRIDGSGRVVLTKAASGVTRSHPTWDGDRILYTRTDSSGASKVEYAYANGWINPSAVGEPLALGGENAPTDGNSAASAATAHLAGGLVGETAFQHKGAAGPEVWVIDNYQRSSVGLKVADGSQPAISPDGTRVAYVGTDGQIHLAPIPTPAAETPQTTVISAGLTAPTHLAWTPDGGSVTFSTASSIESIPSNGTGAQQGAVRTVAKSAGVATYAGAAQDRIERLSFTDPVAGAIAVTQARYQTAKTYQVSQSSAHAYGAVLANPADPDAAALGAGYYPVLYTAAASLDPRTKAELQRLFGTSDPVNGGPTITIVGDTGTVSAATEAAVRNLGYKTTRISGADRYAVNATVLKAAHPAVSGQSVIVVSGDDPAAIATEAFGGLFQQVVLTRGSTLPAAASTYLSRLPSSTIVYVVGASAQSALTSWTAPSGVKVVPLVGADAAQASAVVARVAFGSPLGVILLDPADAADEDVAVTAAQQLGYAILLVDPAKGLEPATRGFLNDSSAGIGTTLVVGPTSTLSDNLVKQAASVAGDTESVTLGVTYAG
jgi:hypothetical protein